MHLTVSLYISALGVTLINAVSVEEKLKPGPGYLGTRDSSEDPRVQRNNPIPLDISRFFIKARSRGYCLRRLSSLG